MELNRDIVRNDPLRMDTAKGNPKKDDITINEPQRSRMRVHLKQICTGSPQPDKGALTMDKEKEVVFFDELGFGWVLDADVLRKIQEKESTEQLMIQRSLAELFRSRKLL